MKTKSSPHICLHYTHTYIVTSISSMERLIVVSKKFKVIEMGGCQREECQTVCAESRRDDLCCLIGLCRMEQFSRAKNMSSLKSSSVWVAARGHWVFSLVTGKERNFSRLFRHNGLDHADIVRKDARLCYIISQCLEEWYYLEYNRDVKILNCDFRGKN